MQSWILDKDFYKSASYLDRRRLQANIYENIHGLASLLDVNDKLVTPKRNVKNHSNIKRWKGYEYHLEKYIYIHLNEWYKRGYKSNINKRNSNMLRKILYYKSNINNIPILTGKNWIPKWVTNELIKQHQQILLEKDYKHYSKYFIKE